MPEISSKYFELHIINREMNKCLLLKRSSSAKIYPGIWQMITGTIEQDESTKNAVRRELLEETGLEAEKIYSIHRINTFYIASLDLICMSPVFLCLVSESQVILSDEHDNFGWFDYEDAIKLIHWPNQIESLKVIRDYISDRDLFGKLTEL